jgi:DNA-binding NarL/FixJ family response regulator
MRLLMVEDSRQDRELLRYLLEERFTSDRSEILEAGNLEDAIKQLTRIPIDVVILDLSLPDSAGKETFCSLHDRFPDVPLIVMTNNQDRQLAMTMIQEGAADYIVKNYTEAEEIFRRIMFAVEKCRTSIRVPPAEATLIKKVERTKAALLVAHQSGEHQTIPDRTVETSAAVADLSRNIYTHMQEQGKTVVKIETQQDIMMKMLQVLDKEILRGHSNRPSMRTQMDVLVNDHKNLEERVNNLEADRPSILDLQKVTTIHHTQIQTTKMHNRTKVILGILTLLGVLAGAGATYYASVQSSLLKFWNPSPSSHD